MKKILFVHPGKSILPELNKYREFFSDYEFYDVVKDDVSIGEVDLLWCFMGVDKEKRDIPVIHEYASLSIGRFSYLKDMAKRIINVKPDLRIFLNEKIKKRYFFNDNVPFLFRDMGVDKCFFVNSNKKEYDFVYVGNMDKDRQLDNMLNAFTNRARSIVMIGKPNDVLYDNYKKYNNIIFTGMIPYKDVPSIASKAKYAINYIPNKYPYNIQTSTKLIEYIAMNLKVITTGYKWINDFEKQRNMRFYKIKEDMSDFNIDTIEKFAYKNNDVHDLIWENILRESNIGNALKKLL